MNTKAYTQDLIERTQLGIKKSNSTKKNQLSKLVAESKQNSARFNEFDPFEVKNTASAKKHTYALGSVNLAIKSDILNTFIKTQPEVTTLKVPVNQKSFFELEIFKVNIYAEEFIYRSSKGENLTAENNGVFYRGIVKGDDNSIVSVSIFGSEIRIMIGDDDGNYIIGKRKDDTGHVLYNDRKLTLSQPETCIVGEGQNLIKEGFRRQVESSRRNSMAKCVPIYVECDFDMYQKHNNSTASVIAFVGALINEMAVIYMEEQIDISLSDVMVWTTSDPYANLNDASAILQKFGELTKDDYIGRLAHFISTRDIGGGIAWVDVLCSNYFVFDNQHAGPYAVSGGMGTSITTFPTYSWNVGVFAHEMGHNMGSPHTQDCEWNNNNTAIDACVPTVEGCTSTYGNCPPSGGTIMSYCNITNCGINFNNGFGTQPGNLIRDRYNNANCVLSCAAPTCDDGVLNGSEEGIDCGGTDCPNCPCYKDEISLSLTFDDYPQETSWTLNNAAGTALYTGSRYTQAGATISVNLNLPPASGYTFTINDAFGDGICCGYGNGSFSLSDKDGTLIAAGNAFGTSFSITFCTEADGGPIDNCPNDPNKTEPGDCGCGTPDEDANNNGTSDCLESDLCPEDRNITASLINETEVNTQKTITTTGTVLVTNSLTFKAGTSISLRPGFHAQAGSNFSAIIQSCTPSNGNLLDKSNKFGDNTSTNIFTQHASLKVLPNPFSQETTIQYYLEKSEEVSIQIMDINGRLIKTLENKASKPSGKNEVRLYGNGLDVGMYFVFLITPTQLLSKKIILTNH